MWQKEQRIIDEFVSPLPPKQTKSFNFAASLINEKPENLAFKVYLDGYFYGEYPLKRGSRGSASKEPKLSAVAQPNAAANIERPFDKDFAGTNSQEKNNQSSVTGEPETKVKPNKKSAGEGETKETSSPEEKTMKDLDF